MWKDPIVEEVRETRRRIMARFNNDPDAYYRHLMQLQEQHKDRVVCRGPVPRAAGKGAGGGE